MEKIKDQIEKEFETVEGNFLVMLNVNAEHYFEAVMESVKISLDRGNKGVYITVSRPYRYISKEMQKKGIDADEMLFLDCISAMAGEHGNGNCIYIENPAALEEISMHAGSLIERVKSDKKVLIMDSFSTLLIYNSKNAVKEFAMFLMNKLRLGGVNGIFVVLEREVPEDLKQILIAMCDKVIYI